VVTTFRAYRKATNRGDELLAYAGEQAIELEKLTLQLNQHGFELEHTMADVGPKLHTIAMFLEQPLVGASIPWLLRRLFFRPYRRR
jgi:hypothetical protein